MTRYRKLFPNEKLGTGMEEKGSMMNRTIKAAVGMVAIAAMSVGTLAACGGSSSSSDNGKGKVYFLNFKPESNDEWQKLAKDYTKETGVEVKVQTAASGTYEQTLKSEIAKSEAPTLFQVNGPVGYQNWKSYTDDMTDTEPYKQLINKDVALKDGSKVVGVPYAMETYGLIYNKDLLAKYIATDGAKIKDVKDIDNFDTLKAVADDIQAKKDQLGVKGAFTSAGFDSSSDWRFKTHLANLPVYFEYQEDGISTTDAIKGTYLDNYKAIWDLYINNSTCEPSELSAKTGDDSRNEFLAGEAVFFQNGSWEYGNLTGEGKYTDDDLAMIPIYIGVGDEANQGLCTGTENYWCVNKEASEDDIQATLDFINWCVTSEQGTKAMADDMGFVIPFKTAQESPNLFVKQDAEMTAAGKTPVSWNFTTMPSEEWKNGVGSALTAYAAGTGDWNGVVSAFVDGWASEAALNAA